MAGYSVDDLFFDFFMGSLFMLVATLAAGGCGYVDKIDHMAEKADKLLDKADRYTYQRGTPQGSYSYEAWAEDYYAEYDVSGNGKVAMPKDTDSDLPLSYPMGDGKSEYTGNIGYSYSKRGFRYGGADEAFNF